jgi:hypothetical protein
MKLNTYTQCVLTVIALCLIWLCVEGHLRPQSVRADGPVKVELVDLDPFVTMPVYRSVRCGAQITGRKALRAHYGQQQSTHTWDMHSFNSLLWYMDKSPRSADGWT